MLAKEESQANYFAETDAILARAAASGAPPAKWVPQPGFGLTVFTKSGGPLTKRIALGEDGSVVSGGGAGVMARGRARRAHFGSLGEFADFISALGSDVAIGLGQLRPDVADDVAVVTKDKLNGDAAIARSGDFVGYRNGQPALVLFDFDSKGMPPEVGERMAATDGFWGALVAVLPQLAGAGHVVRASTSAGLSDSNTGEPLKGSQGQHIYICAQDGTDAERFLQDLHSRCWLTGLGWMMVGEGGQFLERSIVDRMVGGPERLVFEGAPVLVPPIVQDGEARRARAAGGRVLDTLIACPPLTVIEKARLQEMLTKERVRLGGAASQAREAFVRKRGGATSASRMCDGVLLPDVVLPFDEPDFARVTVGDVLENPARYEGLTLADPVEGVSYGRCKAKVMVRADGTPWIHSFAHGRTVYEMKYDAVAVRAKVDAADKNKRLSTFLRYGARAELAPEDIEALADELARQRLGTNKASIRRLLKEARTHQWQKRQDHRREQQRAERRDPRPRVDAPANDAPWLPQVEIVEEALGSSRAAIPPMRDLEGDIVAVRKRRVPGMHGFENANDGGDALPAPEQWLLTKLDEMQAAELIEQHIDYVDEDRRSVHLPMEFVRHNMRRHDGTLPVAATVVTLPVVLSDGTVRGQEEGLDRKRGIVFHIQPELMGLVPRREDCTPEAVALAMRFLTDEWLVDVQTDHAGKCVAIAAALTLIERTMLPDRPVFFITAGRRGGGKTTTNKMLIKAVTGLAMAASAWSPSEEERRKSLHSYLMAAVGYIGWDNIPAGSLISCPHIEKSCTSEYYADRKLGVSETIVTSSAVIHIFSGNNIGPRGDMASRGLTIRIEVTRPDPENREFRHPDPIGWTERNRGKILRMLYTILLGNPELDKPLDAPAETRFKTWWRLVGAAVEHASAAVLGCGKGVCFKDLFAKMDEEDEDSTSLADFLEALELIIKNNIKNTPPRELQIQMLREAGGGPVRFSNPNVLTAAQVANIVNTPQQPGQTMPGYGVVREFLCPDGVSEYAPVSAKRINKCLMKYIDGPVRVAGRTLVLRRTWTDGADRHQALAFKVEVLL